MMMGSCCFLALISSLKRLNSSPVINGKMLAIGWNSYSPLGCCGGVVVVLMGGVLISLSHQPCCARQVHIHSVTSGRSLGRLSQAGDTCPDECLGRVLRD